MEDHLSSRRRLCDILAGQTEEIRKQWDQTEAAADFAPLPTGHYECHVQSGELETNRNGTPQYTLTFRVVEGEYTGRQLWHPLYLTAAALPMAKRDLGKLGVTALDQLERPLPPGRIRCRVRVVLRQADDGAKFNRARSFEVLRIDEPEADPFAPAEDADAEAGDSDAGNAAFHFGANADAKGHGARPPEGDTP